MMTELTVFLPFCINRLYGLRLGYTKRVSFLFGGHGLGKTTFNLGGYYKRVFDDLGGYRPFFRSNAYRVSAR